MNFLMLFDDTGRLIKFFPFTAETPEDKKSELIEQGYIEGNAYDMSIYSNTTGGANGTGYLRDSETGEPIDAPPYVPTKIEIADWLYDKTSQEIKSIENAMTLALINNDANLENLRTERETLVEEYKEALAELQAEDFSNALEIVEGGGNNESSQNDGSDGTGDSVYNEGEGYVPIHNP